MIYDFFLFFFIFLKKIKKIFSQEEKLDGWSKIKSKVHRSHKDSHGSETLAHLSKPCSLK